MRNLAEKWPAAPDWSTASLAAGDVSARTLTGFSQFLVSGDLDAWARASGMAAITIGALSVAKGDRYAVRVARDRILAVSEKPFGISAGWHDSGFAVSVLDAGMHVFEITGPGVARVLARATTLDPAGTTPSASLLVAGVNALVYRHQDAERLRVHVDRGLAPYLWQWLEQNCSM